MSILFTFLCAFLFASSLCASEGEKRFPKSEPLTIPCQKNTKNKLMKLQHSPRPHSYEPHDVNKMGMLTLCTYSKLGGSMSNHNSPHSPQC